MSGARILIITNGHLCRNPRVVKEAQTLGAAGYDVTVLNVHNQVPSVARDAELARGAPYRIESINMLPASGSTAFARRAGVFAARLAVRRLGWQTPGALGPSGALLRRARRRPAELTIVHNEVGHAVGLALRRAGRRVCADIEDWHSEDLLPGDRRGRPIRLLQQQEKELLHTLAYTTTTSHALAAALHERYAGKQPHVVVNAFPLQPDPRPTRGGTRDGPAFFWFSQTLGPGRGLEDFLRAWAIMKENSRVVLLGDPVPNFREMLLGLVPQARRDALCFRDCVPPASLPSLTAEHDIGLALEDPEIPSRDLTITNKILQYANAGLALVASDTAGHREVLSHAPAAGVILPRSHPSQMAKELDMLVYDRAGLERRQRSARSLAESRYCWEREAPRLLHLVAETLSRRAA